MSKRDYYEVLGLAKDATADDLKKAYRKLAMQLHPDRNPNDPTADQKFREINEAYDVLKDDQKRSAYDRYGHAAFEQGGGRQGGGGPGGDFHFASGFADIFDEMFGEFMGGRRGGGAGARGADLRYNMEITLEEAFAGKTTQITIPSTAQCEDCKGTGGANGTAPVECTTCRGAGKVRATQGFFTIERTCPTCHGMGKVIKDPCRGCGGSGRVRKDKTLSVTVPPGVEDGTRIRLTGEGEAGMRGAPNGDLYIFLSVAAHRLFQREGANIHCRVPLTMVTATLGGTIEVPSIDGSRARISVPAGTQAGHQFRLRGKGMSVLRSPSRGDMFVEVAVETPVNLTKRQEELLREFEKGDGGKETSPQSAGFFAKVRELWEDLKD
ncbi:MAG TPA: molecular chaperone DnaJ [Patescibacteria group bacterium]|nr:molecular chaperone DnaJ [Patescibacteria group bacterium]